MWMRAGTAWFASVVDGLDDATLSADTRLPGWTGRHLLAHVAANATALSNLATWARTGVETPMYTSAGQRAADIEAGATRPVSQLRAWFTETADRLAADLDVLTDRQWSAPVRTAQGRTLPASEIPWLRTREVVVHAVDIDPAGNFISVPLDVADALVDDVVAKRSTAGDGPALLLAATDTGREWKVDGIGDAARLEADTTTLAGWLTGRETLPPDAGAQPAPILPPWL